MCTSWKYNKYMDFKLQLMCLWTSILLNSLNLKIKPLFGTFLLAAREDDIKAGTWALCGEGILFWGTRCRETKRRSVTVTYWRTWQRQEMISECGTVVMQKYVNGRKRRAQVCILWSDSVVHHEDGCRPVWTFTQDNFAITTWILGVKIIVGNSSFKEEEKS